MLIASQPRSWPTALVKPGLSVLGSDKELTGYQQLEKQLRAAFDMQPFGEPGQVASCAGALRKRSLQLEEELNHKRGGFEESAAKRLLQELSAQGAREIVDYDSARQMAWAFRVIYNELNPKAGTDLAIEEKLEALKQMLRLKLPSGQQQQILIDLPSMLEKIADYDPEKFKKLFGELSHLLHGK